MKCLFSSNGGIDTKFSKSTSLQSSPGCTCQETKSSSEAPSRVPSDFSGESLGGGNSNPCFSGRLNNLRVFSLIELKTATRNFNRSLLLGEGGFGCVYKGIIRSLSDPSVKVIVAVKQLGRRGLQGHKEWVTEVNVLGVVDHPNLVKLVGYCADEDERGIQRLLVYEFMPNRSVDDHLSGRPKTPPLPWLTRLRIALDSARGLSYLHESLDPQIIFRDFKSSNILLDHQWNAKLSDFGLARLGPADGFTHVSTAAVGTSGYTAPEYFQNGRLSSKNDVWGYGVFLYELITGRRPIEPQRPKNEQQLLEWIKPHLSDAGKFRSVIDPDMGGGYALKSVLKVANVANRCLSRRPRSRPKMSEVVEMVEQVVESSLGLGSPVPTAGGRTGEPRRASAGEEVGPVADRGLRRVLVLGNISCQCCV